LQAITFLDQYERSSRVVSVTKLQHRDPPLDDKMHITTRT